MTRQKPDDPRPSVQRARTSAWRWRVRAGLRGGAGGHLVRLRTGLAGLVQRAADGVTIVDLIVISRRRRQRRREDHARRPHSLFE